jgi:hypothetical protein
MTEDFHSRFARNCSRETKSSQVKLSAPTELPVCFFDGEIVDAGEALSCHEPFPHIRCLNESRPEAK